MARYSRSFAAGTQTATNAQALIASQVLGAGAATITFSSIPATFNHLRLMLVGRSDRGASEFDIVYVQFNGDTGANYDDNGMTVANATVSAETPNNAAVKVFVGRIPAATATAGLGGIVDLDVPAYALTTFQKVIKSTTSWVDQAAANNKIGLQGGNWRSTAAVNQVKLLLFGGNFVTGSAAYLYGVN